MNDPDWGRNSSGNQNNDEPAKPQDQDNRRPGGRQDGPPDLDELWRDFNSRLNRLFGKKGGGNGGGPRGPFGGGTGNGSGAWTGMGTERANVGHVAWAGELQGHLVARCDLVRADPGNDRKLAQLNPHAALVGVGDDGGEAVAEGAEQTLVVGAGGQLGTALSTLLAGPDLAAYTRSELDISNRDSMGMGALAQDVQVSAFPERYDQRRGQALRSRLPDPLASDP